MCGHLGTTLLRFNGPALLTAELLTSNVLLVAHVTCRCLFVPLVGAQASTLASNHRLDGEMTSTDGVWPPWHRFAALLRLSTFNHFTVGIYCTAGCTLVTCRCLFVPLVGAQAST